MSKELYASWLKAKKAEEKARKQRVEIEQELEKLVPEFDGLSKTYSDEGFKITVKKSESYSFEKGWEDIRDSIPETLRPERVKYDVDRAGFDYLKESTNPAEKAAYKTISKYVVFKTGKTGFKIEKE
jgi:hypothetical protein